MRLWMRNPLEVFKGFGNIEKHSSVGGGVIWLVWIFLDFFLYFP